MSDPMNGDWKRLDEGAAASAQMIIWHAPETNAVLRHWHTRPFAALADELERQQPTQLELPADFALFAVISALRAALDGGPA